MGQVTVNFRMDEELKRKLEQVCEELGMNLTTAFTIYAKKVAREKRIPFEVSVGRPISISDMTEAELDSVVMKGIEDHKEGRVFSADDVESEMEKRINGI